MATMRNPRKKRSTSDPTNLPRARNTVKALAKVRVKVALGVIQEVQRELVEKEEDAHDPGVAVVGLAVNLEAQKIPNAKPRPKNEN
jgi:hypothetical protein